MLLIILNDNSPVLTSATDFTVDENTSAVGTITGSDADGDTLAYSISGTDADSLSLIQLQEFYLLMNLQIMKLKLRTLSILLLVMA